VTISTRGVTQTRSFEGTSAGAGVASRTPRTLAPLLPRPAQGEALAQEHAGQPRRNRCASEVVAVVENPSVANGRKQIPPAIAERIRKPLPEGLCVLPGTLPVVSFGDPNQATVATLSLNPSWREFESADGVWLDGSRRRLASLISLGVPDPRELDDEQVATVAAESNGYFRGRIGTARGSTGLNRCFA
jgi:hypothetical protein